MPAHPTGTVTFLFTDIENSTRLAREHPDSWEAAREQHNVILRAAIEANNGFVFQIIGDAFCAAFYKAMDALKAAIKAQQDLQNIPSNEFTIYVRMGIHTGEAENEGDEYRGYTTLSLVQRVMSAGHGGQILISSSTENLLREQLLVHTGLRDMGLQKFAGVPSAVRIFQVVAPDLPTLFPPLLTQENLPNNLPSQLTSFVGREKELADVKRLLQNTHLLTLIGPGGTGKTRLSIQAASEMLDQFADGVWFVELAPILDPQLVPRTTAIAIGLRDEPQHPVIDMLCDYLREKKLLLILDNCEHLVDACARMADRILHAAPDTRILASSREALVIGGEVTYRVPSLGLPDPSHLPPVESFNQYEAVKLFIDRATAAIPTFTVTNENAPALAQICHHLDGIPLAIELAAAKIRVLSVEQIAKRLDDRFRLLTGGSRTALERHQTLRAAIDWSYNLLPPFEQVLFQRLSVFVGGWTLEAAESVCEGGLVKSEDVLDLLEQLINKSLVVTEELSHESRYRMLETIRQYANEKLVELDEDDALRDGHLEFFLNLAEAAEPKLHGVEQEKLLDQLEIEHNNLRAALEWSKTKQPYSELGLRLSGALSHFWEMRGYLAEGRSQLDAVLAYNGGAATPALSKALVGAGTLAWSQTDLTSSLAFHKMALAVQREIGDTPGIAFSLNNLGYHAMEQGDFRQAQKWLDESLALSNELEDRRMAGYALHNLGELARHQGNFEEAVHRYHESLALFRELKDTWAISINLAWLGVVSHHQGELDQATAYLEESLALCQELKVIRGVAEGAEGLARVAVSRGQTYRAALLLGAANTVRANINSPVPPVDRSEYENTLAEVRTTLGKDPFNDAWMVGERLATDGWEKVIGYALAPSPPEEAEFAADAQLTPPYLSSQREAEKQKYGGLTTREREVAGQIAQGKSNQAIADGMFLSLKTVEAHVTRILSKLGFTSRVQIAAWAVSKGLAEAPRDLDTLSKES